MRYLLSWHCALFVSSRRPCRDETGASFGHISRMSKLLATLACIHGQRVFRNACGCQDCLASLFAQYVALSAGGVCRYSPLSLQTVARTQVDHDLHHTSRGRACNFSKRFTLWDKIFGTYVSASGTKGIAVACAKASRS